MEQFCQAVSAASACIPFSSPQSDNPLNEDPPMSEMEFVSDYEEEVALFASDSEQYMMEVERVTEVNTIVETMVNAVSDGTVLKILNWW